MTFEEQDSDADPARIQLDDIPEETTTFLDPVSQLMAAPEDP
jgi:hypothetical protein